MKLRYFIAFAVLALLAWAQTAAIHGNGTGSFTVAVTNLNPFGPPLYRAASTSTANPGTITALFSSRSPSGVVNTGAGGDLKRVDWVSGDNFSTCVPGHRIVILSTQFTIGVCNSSTQLHLTQITNVFTNLAYTFPDVCIGDCQNTVKEDLTIPGHIPGTEQLTRIADGSSMCGGGGVSVGNVSYTGGDNDRMISRLGTYAAFVAGGNACIYHLSRASGVIQVVNSGGPVVIRIAGVFAFSWVTDTRFYFLKNFTQIWRGDITSDTTFTQTQLLDLSGHPLDLFGAGVCPGLTPAMPAWFAPVWTSALDFKADDTRFALSVGPTGGQEHADWVFAWDTTLGCSTANFNSGQAWAWSSIVCPANTCSSSTAALGVMSTANTACWGSAGSTGKGIHSAAMSGDGLSLLVTPTTPWQKGGCAGQTAAAIGRAIWTPGTLSNVWCTNVNAGPGFYKCGGHGSDGLTHLVTANSAGPNIRQYSNVSLFTQYTPIPLPYTDQHGSWPHYCDGVLDDLCAWINASDLVLPSQGGTNAPNYLNNVVFAYWPNAINQTPSVFFHTYSCGWASGPYATCASGGEAYFGAQQSIMVVAPDGSYACFASSMLHNTGLDNLNNYRADPYCGLLQ